MQLINRLRIVSCSSVRRTSYRLCRNYSVLPVADRAYITLTGPDVKKLLQGLTTNDINKLAMGACQPSAFLSSKGRILADTLIYQYENEEKMPCIIIESDPLAVDSLARHLAMYKLRSKVTISKTEFKSFQVNGNSDAINSSGALAITEDPRLIDYNVHRLLFSKETEPDILKKPIEPLAYLRELYLNGIPDSASVSNKIPLECNMDHLHYIDFSKGCYLGQELTARTKYKGIVKKRILPFCFCNEGNELPVSLKKLAYLDRNWLENFVSNSDLVDLKTAQPIEVDGKISKPENISAADGTVVGTLIGSPLFNTSFGIGIGLGMFRLSNIVDLEKNGGFSFEAGLSELKSYACVPFRPVWMNDEIFDAVFKTENN